MVCFLTMRFRKIYSLKGFCQEKKEESLGGAEKNWWGQANNLDLKKCMPLSRYPNLSYLSNLLSSQFYHSDHEGLIISNFPFNSKILILWWKYLTKNKLALISHQNSTNTIFHIFYKHRDYLTLSNTWEDIWSRLSNTFSHRVTSS